MKRSPDSGNCTAGQLFKKKAKMIEESDEVVSEVGFNSLDENLLYEVLKHTDARTLATAACVNKTWAKTATDERLWELICTQQWNNIGCGNQQLRSVVLALGGFRRLHSLYIWPLSKPSCTSTSASAVVNGSGWKVKPRTSWGKDEVHLSLSLLSIRYYEKMNFGVKR